ncbi:MAG: peptidoglycan-associated lipoprotein Pal [Pseudomonadota bacterium]
MSRIKMTSAAIALSAGVVACSSTPPPAPEPEPEVVVEVEEPVVVEEVVPTGPLAGSLEDFEVNVGDKVYFDLDQYRLGLDAQDVLQRQAAWLAAYPGVKILVAGNCDERGTREYNLALGERRASVVKDYLVSLGVDPARIETVSYGKERPIALGSDEAAWAQNRNGFTQILSGTVS